MKKAAAVIFAGIFVVMACGLASANEGKEKGKWQEKKVEKMTKDLGLNTDQQGKVSAILKDNSDKIEAETQKYMDAKKAIRDAEDQQIMAVLTPEQAQKYLKEQAEHKEKMDKKMKKWEKKEGKAEK